MSTRDERRPGEARADWEARIVPRSDEASRSGTLDLTPPPGLRAEPGVGHVRLSWDPVDGAVGYLVHAVPDLWYVDTTGDIGTTYTHAVASVPEVTVTGRLGDTVTAAALPSEGQEIGVELLAALRRVRDEIGVDAVRAHAILHDDLEVYREVDGQPVHDFARIDEVYDLLLSVGLKPTVEIGFMPRDLASDPDKTLFAYRGIISPPKDWDRWADLVHELVDDLLEHTRESGAPVDFVSTHTYGSSPLDLRPTLERLGYSEARILWTEWGVTPTHFNPVNDGPSAGMFLLNGMRSSAGRLDALSYRVASDHFEELGRPPRLLHGGFGLITVGGIAKPRYHALWPLAQLGGTEPPVTAAGDGAAGLVQSWATRRDDGSLAVLVWAHTLDQSKRDGVPELARRVRLQLTGVAAGRATITRLDREHGDITTVAAKPGAVLVEIAAP